MSTQPLNTAEKPMHIGILEIANVKRIRAFGIALEDGEPLILTGDNGAGKSSVFDAIELALTGDGLNQPIRNGARQCSVKLQLSDGGEVEYNIDRRITPKSRSLVVTQKDGSPIASPQKFLDTLIGSLAFDPLEFVRMKPKAQAQAIRELTGLDTSKITAAYNAAFAERTVVNRTVNALKAQLESMSNPELPPILELPEVDLVLPDQAEISLLELVAKRDAMHIERDKCEKSRAALASRHSEHTRAQEEVERLQAELKAALEHCRNTEANMNSALAAFDAINASTPTDEQFSALTQQINDVEATNAGIRARYAGAAAKIQQAKEERAEKLRANSEAIATAKRGQAAYTAKVAELDAAMAEVKRLEKRLENCEEQKLEMARNVTMPVDGMTFDEDGVMIGAVPFDQLSTAEQIRTSAQVAMASNPKLKIILIREGALVNTANLKVILDTAKDRGFQVLLEKFAESAGSVGLHIVDGEVVAINGVAVEEEPAAE